MSSGSADAEIRAQVQRYYGEVLQGSADLQTSACCAAGAPPPRVARALARVHEEVQARFYGCGFPFPDLLEGRVVLDLGCGAGRDVYVLAQLVGPTGRVIGLDMTPAQLEVARRHLEHHVALFGYAEANVRFEQGLIEDLSFLEDESVDVIVSNCVINLSPRKDLVLAEAFRVLRQGGELYLSDVHCDRRLPASVAQDPLLYGECLGGALYDFDFEQLCRAVGFRDPRVVSRSPIALQREELRQKVGTARFSSVTHRLLKLTGLEARCEDYGQLAIYRRPIEGSEALWWLDDHHAFELGRPERVCGNTAAMLQDTRYGQCFDVLGDRSTHYGPYPCGPTLAAGQYAAAAPAAACC
jgi:ubiquinone/menaquinone biosynthesis C-methylase UbiE